MLIYSGEKPFECDQCDKKITQSGHLNNTSCVIPEISHLNVINVKKIYTMRGDLDRHKMTHSGAGEKPFVCGQCDRRFTQSCSLKRHKWTHTGEKPFTCDQYEQTDTRLSNLKQYKKSHTGEKHLHVINLKTDLPHLVIVKKHMLINSGEKPFQCDQVIKDLLNLDILSNTS